MTSRPWPMTVGSLVLREATAVDIEHLLTFRNDPGVNRFMMQTSVDPEKFRKDWLAIPGSDRDFSCVAHHSPSTPSSRRRPGSRPSRLPHAGARCN